MYIRDQKGCVCVCVCVCRGGGGGVTRGISLNMNHVTTSLVLEMTKLQKYTIMYM